MTEALRVGVVGAGILGLAVARRVTQLRPEATVTVLEKEERVASHQTGHNSGVVHAGIYYAPGSLKARLCRRGLGLMKEYCSERGLAYDECGKTIVARDELEEARLLELERRATANGVVGLRRLTADELREVEPHTRGVAALHSPKTAIVDYRAVASAFATDLEQAGATLRLGFEVTALQSDGPTVKVRSADDELRFDKVVVCAGLQSDRVARLSGDARGPAIVPFRGEYYRLVRERAVLVRGLVYPVPDPSYPFLGIHFTRRVDGSVEIGPNAVLALAREGYRRRDVSAGDLRETLAWPGFRRLARQHWRTGLRELRGSVSKRAFVAEAQSYVPELVAADVMPAPAGVRAQAVDADGSLVDDFRIGRVGSIVNVRNAPSPGATSSLAIAEYIAGEVLDKDA